MERRVYHDRARKDMKDQWTKVCKQLVSVTMGNGLLERKGWRVGYGKAHVATL